MLHRHRLYPVAALFLGAALVPTASTQTAKSAATGSNSPVAYVYVSRPTHVDGFAASASGKLTPVPGSPFSDISLSHMSVIRQFLFGAGDDRQSIYSFAIASNGSIKKVSQIDTHSYNPPDNDCFDVGPTQIDFAHTTLYNDDWNCDGDSQYIQSYKIEKDGALQFLANSGGASEDYTMSPPVVLGTDQYLYVTGFYGQGNAGGLIQAYKRQSNGSAELTPSGSYFPATANPDDTYTPYPVLAADPSDHLAFAIQPETGSGAPDGPIQLASYTAQANGNLTTTNTSEDMPTTDIDGIYVMSISPTGKLLAVGGGGQNNPGGGNGFQLFHFNGASPITRDSGVLQTRYLIDQFGWDKSNHLYVLGGGYLFVYTVTPTSIEEAPGSPYSIPEASSVIVLDLQ